MRINTNVSALNAQENMNNTNKSIASSLEKLSSGLALNKAADNASGLAIADKLRTQASSIGQGIANANSASALIQIADKAMAEQSNILDTVKQKLIQAATDTTTSAGREAIRKDITKLLNQFDNIASQTNYNGTTLLQKSDTDTAVQDTLTFQLGEDKTFDVSMQATKASNTSHLGGGSDTIQAEAIATVDGGSSGDNIAVAGTQKMSTTGSVSLQSINLEATGSEIADSGIDVTLSGQLGKVVTSAADDMLLDASSETQAIKDSLEAIADNNANIDWNATTGILSVDSGAQSVDLGDLEFSSLRVYGATPLVELSINNGGSTTAREFSVTNNATDTTKPLLGQINIASTNTGGVTGGQLLSDLKDLATDGLTNAKANSFMATIDESLTQLNASRSDFGSTQNQLASSIRNMQTTQTNLKAAESVIRDTDFAQESANFNKQNIIAQAGTYAMSQANAMQQNVMRLLQ